MLTRTARLTGPDTADVDGQPVRFRPALPATGTAPAIPSISGLDGARVLTSETVWQLAEPPARLAVLGGGPIGCELSQAFTRLGAHVILVEGGERPLGKEDPDDASLVADRLRLDGVRLVLVLGEQVSAITHHDRGGELVLADDSAPAPTSWAPQRPAWHSPTTTRSCSATHCAPPTPDSGGR